MGKHIPTYCQHNKWQKENGLLYFLHPGNNFGMGPGDFSRSQAQNRRAWNQTFIYMYLYLCLSLKDKSPQLSNSNYIEIFLCTLYLHLRRLYTDIYIYTIQLLQNDSKPRMHLGVIYCKEIYNEETRLKSCDKPKLHKPSVSKNAIHLRSLEAPFLQELRRQPWSKIPRRPAPGEQTHRNATDFRTHIYVGRRMFLHGIIESC